MSDYGGDDDGQGAFAEEYGGGYDDMDEPIEPELDEGDAEDQGADGAEAVTEDPDARRPVGQDNIVVSGDASQARTSKNAVQELKDKKIAKENRNTTPYMTKYERARVLGTRALQIR
jgi:DNA-directed RNA polymerase I, II, and III subunit RPABC2